MDVIIIAIFKTYDGSLVCEKKTTFINLFLLYNCKQLVVPNTTKHLISSQYYLTLI